jgi:hypothetical protein
VTSVPTLSRNRGVNRAGVNRVSSVPQTTGRWLAGTPTFSISCDDDSHTGFADSRWLVTAGVGPSTTHGDGAPRARSKGVTGADTGTARFDHRGESRVEKPRGNDFPVDGSPRDRAAGRSRARVETRPADLGRVSPETDRQQAGFPLCREAAPVTARRMSPEYTLTYVGRYHIDLRLAQIGIRPAARLASVSGIRSGGYR